jgi:hypothetical protein
LNLCTNYIFGVETNSITATTPNSEGVFLGTGTITATSSDGYEPQIGTFFWPLQGTSMSFMVTSSPISPAQMLADTNGDIKFGGYTAEGDYLSGYVTNNLMQSVAVNGASTMIGVQLYELGNSLALATGTTSLDGGLADDRSPRSLGLALQACVLGGGYPARPPGQ